MYGRIWFSLPYTFTATNTPAHGRGGETEALTLSAAARTALRAEADGSFFKCRWPRTNRFSLLARSAPRGAKDKDAILYAPRIPQTWCLLSGRRGIPLFARGILLRRTCWRTDGIPAAA